MYAVLVSGFAERDWTTLVKVNSGCCWSLSFLASGYVKFLVTFNFMISFSFFQTSQSLDLDKWSFPQFTHCAGFVQWLV